MPNKDEKLASISGLSFVSLYRFLAPGPLVTPIIKGQTGNSWKSVLGYFLTVYKSFISWSRLGSSAPQKVNLLKKCVIYQNSFHLPQKFHPPKKLEIQTLVSSIKNVSTSDKFSKQRVLTNDYLRPQKKKKNQSDDSYSSIRTCFLRINVSFTITKFAIVSSI